jgi:hypothetical protein
MATIATKFVKWDVQPLENLKDCKAYILRQKVNDNIKLTRDEKNWITKQVNDNTYFHYGIPVMGWCFDFSDILKTFVVKQYGSWTEYKAIDKTALRKMIYGRIDKIIDVL